MQVGWGLLEHGPSPGVFPREVKMSLLNMRGTEKLLYDPILKAE